MTNTVSSNFIASFDALVKKDYQMGMKLRDKVRVKTGVVGSTHRFPKIGKGTAQPRIPQTDVTPMNLVHSNVTATLSDWIAADYSDVYDLEKLNFDEKKEIMDNAIMAIGRRLDQLVINAMAASANGTQIATSVGGTDTGLNLEKFLRAKRLMDDAGVPEEGRYIACSARAIEQALLETEVTSGDFNILKPLMAGQIKGFAGFEIIFIESRTEGGIPLATNTRNNFAFHKDAVGLAVGMDIVNSVDWIAEKTSHLIQSKLSAGAVTIDTAGVYDLLTHEA